MSLFGDTKALMQDYIDKTNEIYNSTTGISTDIRNFNNNSVDTKAGDILASLGSISNDVDASLDAINDLSDCSDSNEDAINDIKDSISNIKHNISLLLDDSTFVRDEVTTLKDNYSIVDATVSGLSSSIKEWITKSSEIFGYTVDLLEKAKRQGCT